MDPNIEPTVIASPDDLTGKAIGRFQITALLGKGGMGEVYLAEDSLLKRSVAVKRVSAALRSDPQYRELLIKEAERASRLNDERVAHIHDVLEHQGEIFLVMEYVEGKSLRHWIGHPLPLDEFLNIATQCAEALVAAYQSNVVHRDLKPENIMITPKGRVKICDFGLARQVGWGTNATTIIDGKSPVGFRGTPAYMAPEALLKRNPDCRADIFSLGIVFYELLSGRHPFREENNLAATADRIIHATPAPAAETNSDIPKELSAIIDKMLRKQPSERYASPSELLSDLQAVKRMPPMPRRLTKWRRYAAASVLLIALLVLAFALFRLERSEGPPAAAHQRNLVVLPFRAMGDSAESQFYSGGLTESVTARLGRATNAPDLLVTPASEVHAKRVATAEEARKQFAADLILAGTLYPSPSGVRLTYSLYDAMTLRQIKADTIAAGISNPFALEEQIVGEVLSALAIPDKSASRQEKSDRQTSVAAAYDSYLRGRGHLQDPNVAEHLQTAVQSFQHAAELDPGYATAYAALGEAYWAKYESTKEPVWVELARQSCERSDTLDANSVDAKVCLGTVNFGTGQYETAAGDFQNALEINPASDSAYLGLANTYERLGNYEAAERTLLRAVQEKPNFYLPHSRLGQFYLRRARYQDAADQYQKEITLVPNSEGAYMRIGNTYLYLGRYEDAITVYRRSIELRPTAAAYSNLGSTYLRLHRFDQAVPVFEQAVRLFPRNFIFAGNLARAYYWSTTQREKAASAYERAITLASDELQINPRHSDAHIMLGRYYAMLGKKPDALNHLNHALILRPAEAEYFSIAAVIHNQFGDRSSTLASLAKAVSLGWSVAEIRSEVEFDNLRQYPEFGKLIQPNP